MSWFKGAKRGRASSGRGAYRAGNSRSVNYSSSPLLASKTPPWRSRLLVAGVGLGFCLLLGRALYIQVIGTDFFQKQGENRYAHSLELPASRGRIVDRSGQVLASSVAVPSIWAIPKDVDADPVQRKRLAKLLEMTPKELDSKLAASPKFVWLRRQVETQAAQQIKLLNLNGVFQEGEYKRKYPEGEASAHVVGFTNSDERGQEGIELAFQQQLQGRDGSRNVVKDRLGRVVEDIGERIPPINGQDIDLSIDSKVQFFAYQRIREAVTENKAKAGSVVVLDVITGEILALANYPSFNPSDRRHLSGNRLRNRALTDTFEPGSTMKPLIAALALDTGRVRPETMINTAPRSLMVGNWSPSDEHVHQTLSVAEVIQKSSNIGAARLAMQMQPREMHEMFTQVGLGQRPQIHYPGVVTGRLRPYRSWRPIEQATMAFGYGLSVSLLQLAHAYTVFARDGELIPISLIKQPDEAQGVRVFSPKTAQAVRLMLQMAAGQGGTSPLAQTQGYSVGGKSGTAYKQEGKGYALNKYRSWFVGLAPINNPRLVVAVMVDEPSAGKHFGGQVAAPVFSQVVQQSLRLLGVSPDLDVKPQIVARQAGDAQESF